MAERGVKVDHATLYRRVVKYTPLVGEEARARKTSGARSWRVDETYIKVKGKWTYYYRAIDKFGKTLDFMLSEKRDLAAASDFFGKTGERRSRPGRNRQKWIQQNGAQHDERLSVSGRYSHADQDYPSQESE